MNASGFGIVRASVLGMAAVSIVGTIADAGPTQSGYAFEKSIQSPRGGAPGQSPFGFPAPGSVGVSIEADLSWFQAVNTFSYDVYFGTDSTPDATEFLGNTAGLSFSLDTLDWDTTYYWRIDSFGGAFGTTAGIVWFFTTEPQPTPDLFVTDVIYTTPASFYPGDEYFVSVFVRNDGEAGADVVGIGYYASLDNVITPDDILLGLVNDAFDLPSGANNGVALGLHLPEDFPPGDYYFGAYVTDFEGLDDNLSNNGRADFTSRTVLPPRYDLRAWVCSYDTSVSYAIGDTIDVTSRVLNQGDLATTGISIEYYASTDSTITRDDIWLGQLDYFGTPIDEGTTWIAENTPVSLFDDELLTPGAYYIGIYVLEGVDGDENLANNGLAGEFPITIIGPCPADLTNDGILNFFDVSAFLSAFTSGDPLADFTGDGTYNFFDVSAFLQAFAAGCP